MKKIYTQPHSECILIQTENLMGLPASCQKPPESASAKESMTDDEYPQKVKSVVDNMSFNERHNSYYIWY